MCVFKAVATLAEVPAPPAPASVDKGIVSYSEYAGIAPASVMAGAFRVNEAGAATYSIPITVPDGIAGVRPSLALTYSSAAGRGLVGPGWSLDGVSAISRCRQVMAIDGAPKPLSLSSQDRFCLNGKRLILVRGSTYGAVGAEYRFEIDDFSIITSYGGSLGHPDYFIVRAKDGSSYQYGAVGGAAQVESEEGLVSQSGQELGTTLQWALDVYQDNVGNKIDYSYSFDYQGFRLSTIHYAYVDSEPNSRIALIYGNGAPYNYSDQYVKGFKRKIKSSLIQVDAYNKAGGQWHRNYYYKIIPTTGRKIGAVQKCYTWSSSSCQKAANFTYSASGYSLKPNFGTGPDIQHRVDGNHDRVYRGHQYADINGDGQLDIMWLMANYDSDGELRDLSWKNVLSKSRNNGEPDGYRPPAVAFFKTWKGGTPWEWKLIDYNGDSRADLATFHHSLKR